MKSPTPEQVRQLRASCGLTQAAFGALIHASLRAVQNYEGGQRRMHAGLWALAQERCSFSPARGALSLAVAREAGETESTRGA